MERDRIFHGSTIADGRERLHRRLFHRFSSPSLALVLRWKRFLWESPRLHGFALELCSFLHRIRALGSAGYRPSCETGLYFELDPRGFLAPNKMTRSRSGCIQKLHACQPWLSPADWNLILKGWDEGYKFGVEQHGTQESRGIL